MLSMPSSHLRFRRCQSVERAADGLDGDEDAADADEHVGDDLARC